MQDWGHIHGHLLSRGLSADGLSGRSLLDLTYALTADGLPISARKELDAHMLKSWFDRETWVRSSTPPSIPAAPLRVGKDGARAPR